MSRAVAALVLLGCSAAPRFTPEEAEAARRAAAPHVARPVPIPEGHGGWIFHYACPADGSPLAPPRHECSRCRKASTDERTLAAYRAVQHQELETAAAALGRAFAATGESRYAAEVKRLLLGLADRYAGYPDRLDRWGRKGLFAPLGGRRYVQSLDEAVGVIRLAKAYDDTRAAWTAEERGRFERGFLRPTAVSLLRFNQDVNNHQTWYNAGLMWIAAVLDDAALARKVMEMKGGVEDQFRRSIGSDGLWYEGAMAYHNYALQAMVEIAEAGRRMGLEVHCHPRLRAMIEAPRRAAYPNGQFPAINDSDPGDLGSFAWAFEWAAKTFGAPVEARPVERSEALAGLAALRRGGACAFLDFGPHGGGHGHFDKLNLMLFANGREWLLDPGRLTYSHPEYRTWVKHTAAHNTVTLGGRSQRATTGRLLWLREGEGWSACAAESDGAYPGAMLRRYLMLMPEMLVDVFEVEAAEPAQIDWLVHALADRVAGAAGEGRPAAAGGEDGYPHLADAVAYPSRPGTPWEFVSGTLRLRLWFDGTPEEVIAARGIGYHVEQKVPCLIRRRQGREARFVTVYDLTGDASFVRHADGLRIETARGPLEVTLGRDGAAVKP